MNHHTTTRIPVNDDYAALVGKAVYVFAYYEWTIIWITEHLSAGFVQEYSRESVMTSGRVKMKFEDAIQNLESMPEGVTEEELVECKELFSQLIDKRNALIHAHPCTDNDGSQILAYQTKITKPIPDMKWPVSEVNSIISEFDSAGCIASGLLDRLRT